MTENPFDQIKSTKPKRRGSLSAPPKPQDAGKNVALPEHTPAVAAKAPRREYRVSTYLTEESGVRFEQLHALMRRTEGRKVKQAEVLEQALLALEQAIKR